MFSCQNSWTSSYHDGDTTFNQRRNFCANSSIYLPNNQRRRASNRLHTWTINNTNILD